MKRVSNIRGFTLIELLVVISIISFISSVVMSSVIKARIRARDSQRIQNARQIAIALEQYEHTFSTYKVANAGLGDTGTGYIAKGSETGGYNNSILSALKASGLYTNTNLKDPIFGSDNYYLGLCTSTNAYNVFVKLEQPQYSNATSSVLNSCGGIEASALGFNFIASTAGGSSGGGDTSGGSGYTGVSDIIIDQEGLTYQMVTGEDGKIWLDRNLGATRVALNATDTAAYGDLYQWGRGRDGHQKRNSALSTASSSLDMPGNTFIYLPDVAPWDWHTTQQSYYWTGENGGPNNPCPSGFRVPTIAELYGLVNAIPNFKGVCGAGQCSNVAANSKLKLPASGWRAKTSGNLTNVGQNGLYWASNTRTGAPTSTYVTGLYWSYSGSVANDTYDHYRANAFAVRCIKG